MIARARENVKVCVCTRLRARGDEWDMNASPRFQKRSHGSWCSARGWGRGTGVRAAPTPRRLATNLTALRTTMHKQNAQSTPKGRITFLINPFSFTTKHYNTPRDPIDPTLRFPNPVDAPTLFT